MPVRCFVVILISRNFLGVSIDHYSPFLKVGENGAGKTTLLKILLGELNPVKGIRHAHRNLKIGYFSQHHIDQLEMNMNSVEVLAAKLPGTVNVEKFIGPVQRYIEICIINNMLCYFRSPFRVLPFAVGIIRYLRRSRTTTSWKFIRRTEESCCLRSNEHDEVGIVSVLGNSSLHFYSNS